MGSSGGMQAGQIERYARHLVLKEIGGPGQNALLSANICIVGAGGLGGPAGLYLAGAGIGRITLIDDDVVGASNLQRQVQFTHVEIGLPKARIMADTLRELNPDVEVRARQTRLTPDNAADLLGGHDLILDGTDSFETRLTINAAAHGLSIPVVSGAVGRFDGQVGVFGAPGPCYQCFVPEVPPDAETCSQVGVVGALTGVVGSVMALETIKLITGAGQPLSGRLWLYDGLSGESRTVSISHDPACPICSSGE